MYPLILIVFIITAETFPQYTRRIATGLLNSHADTLDIIVYLKVSPQYTLAQKVKSQYSDELHQIQAQIDTVLHRYRLRSPTPQVNEHVPKFTATDKEILHQLIKQREQILTHERAELAHQLRIALAPYYADINKVITSLGGHVKYTYLTVSAIAARVPKHAVEVIADNTLVAYVGEDRIMHAQLNISTHAICVDPFWEHGFRGGVYDGGILDTGVDIYHPALNDIAWFEAVFHESGQHSPWYADDPDTTDDLQGHGTHVAGIAFSTGSIDWEDYKGVAYGIAYEDNTYGFNMKAGWRDTNGWGRMYWSDAMAAIDWAVTHPVDQVEAINLSVGACTSVDETDFSRFLDATVDIWDVFISVAAGNYNPDNPCTRWIHDPAISYNAAAVAGMTHYGTIDRADDYIMWWSALGPTPNGRRKPDIAAPGHGITSTNNEWENNGTLDDFIGLSGTSMAAPHVMGAALLLMDAGVPSDPKIIKALLIRNSEPWSSPYYEEVSWSDSSGWGYINLSTTWAHLSDYFVFNLKPKGQYGDYKLFKGYMFEDDRAILVWNRHAIYSGDEPPNTYYDLNNIDIRLYDHNTGAIVDYDNTVNDNVHEVTAETDGEYVIKVYSQDTQFEGVTSEEVVLATPEGFVEASPPAFIIRIKHPEPILPGATFPMVVEVENYGDVSAFNVSLNVNIPAEFTIISGETSQNLGTILPNSAKSSDTLVLIAPTTTGEYVVEAFAYSQSYNEAYERCDSSVMHISLPIRLSLLQCVDGGSGYCSQNSPILQFGLRMESIDTIVVEWTSGIRMLITGGFVTNGIMDISEPNLPGPYPLDVVDVGTNWLHLCWEDNSTNEDGFQIERAISPDGPFTTIATVGANVTYYIDDGLTPHTTYYYRVCGVISEPNFTAYSPYSNVAYATTGEPPISLAQTRVVDGGSGYCSQNSPVLQFGLFNTFTIDTIFVYWPSGIIAYYTDVEFNQLIDIDEPHLPAPYPLSITEIGNTSLWLYWQDNSIDEDGFRIERAASPDGPFSPIATVGANVTEYMDDNLTPHTTYYYRVCGFISEPDFVAYSPYSNVAYAITGEPPVSLTQIRVVDGGSGYCSQNSHVLQFGLSYMFTIDTIFVYWPSGIIDTIVDVEADQQLTIVEGTTVNQPPLPFSLIAPQDGGYVNFADTFDWQDAVDNIPQGDIVYYDLYISSDPNFSTNVIVIDSLMESQYPVANVPWSKHMMLTNHTFKRWRKHPDIVSFYRNKHSTKSNEYYWKVKAYDRYGAITWSNETWQFELDTIAPTTPIIISPIDVYLNTDTVNFIWSQSVSKAITSKATTKLLLYDITSPYKATKFPKNIASAPVHYVFELDTTVNFSSSIIIDTVDDTSYTVYGLIDANYYWRISAYDDAGNQSNWSYATFGIDRTPPEIVNFTHYNDTSGVDSLAVYATVYDALAGLDSLLLLYNVDDTGWVHQTMTPIDTNTFVGWLTDVAGHHVHYFLRAVDKAIPPNVNITDTVSFLIVPVEEGLHPQPDIEISHHISYVKFILRGRNITLSIYDVAGRLLLRRRSPCEVIFKPASSGVYFWHTSGSICRSDKIVVIE